MSVYRDIKSGSVFNAGRPVVDPYQGSAHKSQLKKRLLEGALGMGAFVLLKGAGSKFSKILSGAIESGVFKKTSFLTKGYKEAKNLGILKGTFSDVFRIFSSTFRKADYAVSDVTKGWTRAFEAFTKFTKKSVTSGRATRLIRTGRFFEKYPVKNIVRGAFVRGARDAVGFTFLSSLSTAFVHSIKPEERDVNKKYGIKAIPRVSKEFVSSLGTNVLFFGLGKTFSTAAKVSFYGPGMRNLVMKTGFDKLVGHVYGARQRMMEALVGGSTFARRFGREIHAVVEKPYVSKHHWKNYRSAFRVSYREAVRSVKKFKEKVSSYDEVLNSIRDLKERVPGKINDSIIGRHIYRNLINEQRLSSMKHAFGFRRVGLTPKEALETLRSLRDIGFTEKYLARELKGLGLDPNIAHSLFSLSEKEFAKLYNAGKLPLMYREGITRIGQYLHNRSTMSIFKNTILANVPEHYKGLANIMSSVLGGDFYGSRLLARFVAPAKGTEQRSYIIGQKNLVVADRTGIRHGVFYYDGTWYKVGDIDSRVHDVSVIAQGLHMYESKMISSAKGEAMAHYLSENGPDRVQKLTYSRGAYLKRLLKKVKKLGGSALTADEADILSDRYDFLKLNMFAKMIEDEKIKRHLIKAFGEDSQIAKVLNMDPSALVQNIRKIIENNGVASPTVKSHLDQVLGYAEMYTNDELKQVLAQNHVGREFSRVTMGSFLRSFIIDRFMPDMEARVKFSDRMMKEVVDKLHLPKLYRDWVNIMKHLPPSPGRMFMNNPEKAKLFVRGVQEIPKVDIYRPFSAILKLGNLGIDSPFNLNNIFNPETGRYIGLMKNQPFVALEHGFIGKRAPTPFEVWASTPVRSVWGMLGGIKNMLSIKKETIDYARDRIPFLNKMLTMEPFSSLQNGVSLIPFNTDVGDKTLKQVTKDLWKPLALYGGLTMSYKLVDTILDEFPIPGLHDVVEHSAFGEGLTPFLYNTYGLGRLALAKMGDITGITQTAQYLEGLMPGSTTWLPGAITGAVMGSPLGLSGAALSGLIYGGVNRMLSPFLPDLTKSTQDIEDLYSGRKEVAVKKNRYWPLSLTPWEGTGIDYYRPSTFHMVQSQFRNTQSGVGSKWQDLLLGDWMFGFNPIREIFDPMYKERQHYFSRPAPLTQLPFWDMPLIGPALAVTIGQTLKPQQMMHMSMLRETLPGVVDHGPGNNIMVNKEGNNSFTPQEVFDYMENDQSMNMMMSSKAKLGKEISSSIYGRAASEVLYRTMELGGLRGYLTSIVLGTQTPFAADRYLQMYGENDGFMSDYWTMNMNDIAGGLSEMMRRMGPAHRIKTENPLESSMVSNFPYNLSIKGDPYTTIKGGMFRLPGPAYEALHDVLHTYPASAQMLGRTVSEIRDIMVGWKDIHDDREKNLLDEQMNIRELIISMFNQSGMLVASKKPIYDVKNNIIGIADAVIKRGKTAEILSIKPMDEEDFMNLVAPNESHVSEVNFLLGRSRIRNGRVVYVNTSNPAEIKDYVIKYDPHRLEEDISNIKRAREKAEEIRREGYAIDYGRSYSWLNKLKIYADVAPFSDQYKMALSIVEKQIKSGVLPPETSDEVESIIEQRNARLQRYPIFYRRFSSLSMIGTVGDILRPKKVTSQQLKASFSPFLKPSEEYSLPERVVGAFWESFTHLNTPYHRKFFFQQDPYELYKNFHLYDKEYKSWTKPYADWVKPYFNTAVASKNMLEGIGNFTTLGWLLGSVEGASIAGAFGGLYAPISNIGQRIFGTFKPASARKGEKVIQFYDRVRYVRNLQFYNMTGNKHYLDEANNTMTGASSISSYMKGLPGNEKFFASAFMDVTDPKEQALAMDIAPNYMKPVLNAAWTGRDVNTFIDEDKGNLPIPDSDWPGWASDVNLDDVETKELMMAGVNPRDYGFGYNDQLIRASSLQDDIAVLSNKDISDFGNINFTEITNLIRHALSSYGINATVTLIGSPSDSVNVKVFL